jgi:hypothetical protein
VNVNNHSFKKYIFCFVLVTLDMYRMLQAVERQPTESSVPYDEKAIGQSLIPTSNQPRDIYVRIFLCQSFIDVILLFRISMMVIFKIEQIPINIFFINQHLVKFMRLPLLLLKNYLHMVLFFFIYQQMVMIHI